MKAALALLAFAVAAHPSLLPQGTTPAPVTLRRALKADAVDTYTVENKVEQSVVTPVDTMPMTIDSAMTYELKTTKVDDTAGVAQIQATTTFDKITADGAAASIAGPDKPKPVVQTGKLDARGRMTFDPLAPSTDLANLLSGSQAGISAGSLVEFPEKSVKVGDSWEIVVPKSPMLFDQDQKLTATLTGERDVDGTPAWVVSIKGTIQTSVDTSKIPNTKPLDTPLGPTTIRIKGAGDVTGEGLVEKSTGRTLSMASKTLNKATIEFVESGFKLEATGTLTSTIKLKPAG